MREELRGVMPSNFKKLIVAVFSPRGPLSATGKGSGLPGGDRTPDPQLRRLMLYPTELRTDIRDTMAPEID